MHVLPVDGAVTKGQSNYTFLALDSKGVQPGGGVVVVVVYCERGEMECARRGFIRWTVLCFCFVFGLWLLPQLHHECALSDETCSCSNLGTHHRVFTVE